MQTDTIGGTVRAVIAMAHDARQIADRLRDHKRSADHQRAAGFHAIELALRDLAMVVTTSEADSRFGCSEPPVGRTDGLRKTPAISMSATSQNRAESSADLPMFFPTREQDQTTRATQPAVARIVIVRK